MGVLLWDRRGKHLLTLDGSKLGDLSFCKDFLSDSMVIVSVSLNISFQMHLQSRKLIDLVEMKRGNSMS